MPASSRHPGALRRDSTHSGAGTATSGACYDEKTVRFHAIVVAGLWCALPAPVHAETPAELQAKGEQLAKDGRFSEAIDAFKAADRIERRASHACLIALAYTRR